MSVLRKTRPRPVRTLVAVTKMLIGARTRRSKSTLSARIWRSGFAPSGLTSYGESIRAAMSIAANTGEYSSVQRPVMISSGPRRSGLSRAASDTRFQNCSSATRACGGPPAASPSAITTAFIAPAEVPETPSKRSHDSSSRRSRTPQVNAPCAPPPCSPRSTDTGSRSIPETYSVDVAFSTVPFAPALDSESGKVDNSYASRRGRHMDAAASSATAATTAWHALATDEVQQRLGTSEAGLDAAEASSRLQQYGPNRLPEGKKRGPLLRFLSQLNNVLIYVLLGAGFVKLMLGLWVDGAIILGVVLINALLGFIQEGKAEKALDSIRNMLSAEARTVRGGETRMLPADELVPGDVVLLESGDKVPADLRLTEVKNLRTEEAALTGESVPTDKSVDPVAEKSTVGDRASMAFSGTMVVSGRATGVAVTTGSDTELGKINQLLASVSALETPLLRQIKKFGYAITVVIAVVSVVIFAYGKWVMGMDFISLFQAVVAITVSVIPEGLPAIITITLAIGVQRMAQRNAIIRRLPAVETLGSVSRICSDKTGTLTLMEMMVVSAATAESEYQITGNGYAPEGEVKENGKPADKKDPVLGLLGRVSMLCNDAELFQQEGLWKVEGDPTEGALYPFATKLGMDRQAEQAAYPRIDAIPFESEHKFMATLHRSGDGKEILLVKGAPEVILDACDRQQTASGEAVPLDRDHFMKASDRLAAQGERVLALAWLENPGVKAGSLGPADLPKNLVLLGLIGLLDPPRKEAIEAVKECHGGGIRVTMITGDHKITAAAIARMLGIGDGRTAITGGEIEEMNTAALQERVREVDVFARASPEHKLRLVKAIQANRQIVAMTGDGVNDAPSLKKADIGVAMGIKGTEVTKEAAEMILADDNFA